MTFRLTYLFMIDLALLAVVGRAFETWDFYAIALSSPASTAGTVAFFSVLALTVFLAKLLSDEKMFRISVFQLLFGASVLLVSFLWRFL